MSVSTVGGLSAGLSRLDFVINTTEHKGKHKEKENIWNIFDAINTLFKLNCFLDAISISTVGHVSHVTCVMLHDVERV